MVKTKLLKLSLVFTALISTQTFADNINFTKEDNVWTLVGYESAQEYENMEVNRISNFFDYEIAKLQDSDDPDKDTKISMLEENKRQSINQIKRDVAYIKETMKNLDSGMNKTDAKVNGMAAAEQAVPDLEPANNDGYNSAGFSGEAKSNMFKQFNELDCSYDEVSNYVSTKHNENTKAFNSLPTVKQFQIQQGESTKKHKRLAKTGSVDVETEEEKNACDLFSGEPIEIPDMPEMPSWDEILAFFESGGEMISTDGLADKVYGAVGKFADDLKQGICKRMKPSNLEKVGAELLDEEYQRILKDTKVNGSSLKSLGKESGQNSFTYKLIKNQTEMSDSRLIKAVDVTRDDNHEHANKIVDDKFDDMIDDLEDSIFG